MRKRIIKFRGKRLDNGEWVDGFVLFNQDKSEAVIAKLTDTESVCENVIPDTVGQFTGYHDLNDKRIYEGDIVKFTAHDALGNELGNQQGVVKFKFGSYLIGGYDMYDILLNDDEAEIVGNIYDNPELLNRKDE